jgi:hypothetical protein
MTHLLLNHVDIDQLPNGSTYVMESERLLSVELIHGYNRYYTSLSCDCTVGE